MHGKNNHARQDNEGTRICEHVKGKRDCRDCGDLISPSTASISISTVRWVGCYNLRARQRASMSTLKRIAVGATIYEQGTGREALLQGLWRCWFMRHGRRKDRCEDCAEAVICEHGEQKRDCMDYWASSIGGESRLRFSL